MSDPPCRARHLAAATMPGNDVRDPRLVLTQPWWDYFAMEAERPAPGPDGDHFLEMCTHPDCPYPGPTALPDDVAQHVATCITCRRAGYTATTLRIPERAFVDHWGAGWWKHSPDWRLHLRIAHEHNVRMHPTPGETPPPGSFASTIVVTLTPPPDTQLGDGALWIALAVGGRWSGTGRSYHASTAVVIALQALTDALRADFPRAHGWKASTPRHPPAHGDANSDWICDGTEAGCQCACILCLPENHP